MALDITVSLSPETYKRLQQWATLRQQNIETVIQDYLAHISPPTENLVIPPAEPDKDLERERTAYIQMHPDLYKLYAGQYVAIYGGELIDHDMDQDKLFERIDKQYPDEFVWLSRVDETPEQEVNNHHQRWWHG